MDKSQKLHQLQKAQEKLQKVIDLVEEVFPNDAGVQSYFIEPLKIRVSAEHGFLARDMNLDDLMIMVEGDPDDFEELKEKGNE